MLLGKRQCCAGPECGSLAFSAINAAGSPGDLDRGANFAAFRPLTWWSLSSLQIFPVCKCGIVPLGYLVAVLVGIAVGF
jgi:hypothetical protein